MKKIIMLVIAAGCAAVAAAAGKGKPDSRLPPSARPEIRAAVEAAARKPHPRLFADAAGFDALKGRIATDAFAKMGADYVRARVEVVPEDGSLMLRQGGQEMRLAQTGALTGAWTVGPAKGPNPWDGENRGVLQVSFTVAMPEEGDARLAVTFSRP